MNIYSRIVIQVGITQNLDFSLTDKPSIEQPFETGEDDMLLLLINANPCQNIRKIMLKICVSKYKSAIKVKYRIDFKTQ